jgi:hypothetical protein
MYFDPKLFLPFRDIKSIWPENHIGNERVGQSASGLWTGKSEIQIPWNLWNAVTTKSSTYNAIAAASSLS